MATTELHFTEAEMMYIEFALMKLRRPMKEDTQEWKEIGQTLKTVQKGLQLSRHESLQHLRSVSPPRELSPSRGPTQGTGPTRQTSPGLETPSTKK